MPVAQTGQRIWSRPTHRSTRVACRTWGSQLLRSWINLGVELPEALGGAEHHGVGCVRHGSANSGTCGRSLTWRFEKDPPCHSWNALQLVFFWCESSSIMLSRFREHDSPSQDPGSISAHSSTLRSLAVSFRTSEQLFHPSDCTALHNAPYIFRYVRGLAPQTDSQAPPTHRSCHASGPSPPQNPPGAAGRSQSGGRSPKQMATLGRIFG